jgi:undecaprenyl-diphosphatase
MTTFQAVVYALVHGWSEFFPISAQAHHALLADLTGWQPPSGALMTALLLGSASSLLIYFRHDWASMISSVLQVVIFRKKPMTLDERIPLFVGLTILPLLAASFYFGPVVQAMEWTPWKICAALGGTALPLWFFDYWGRKTKGFYDWNVFDALAVGVSLSTALVPGWDRLSGLLLGAFLLNYKREAALKYAYFVLFPILASQAGMGLHQLNFHAPQPMADLSWMSFFVAMIVSCLMGLLVIGGAMKHISQKGLGQLMGYRIFLVLGVLGFLWYRSGL